MFQLGRQNLGSSVSFCNKQQGGEIFLMTWVVGVGLVGNKYKFNIYFIHIIDSEFQ